MNTLIDSAGEQAAGPNIDALLDGLILGKADASEREAAKWGFVVRRWNLEQCAHSKGGRGAK